MAGLVFLLVFWVLAAGAGGRLLKARRGRVFIAQFFFFCGFCVKKMPVVVPRSKTPTGGVEYGRAIGCHGRSQGCSVLGRMQLAPRREVPPSEQWHVRAICRALLSVRYSLSSAYPAGLLALPTCAAWGECRGRQRACSEEWVRKKQRPIYRAVNPGTSAASLSSANSANVATTTRRGAVRPNPSRHAARAGPPDWPATANANGPRAGVSLPLSTTTTRPRRDLRRRRRQHAATAVHEHTRSMAVATKRCEWAARNGGGCDNESGRGVGDDGARTTHDAASAS